MVDDLNMKFSIKSDSIPFYMKGFTLLISGLWVAFLVILILIVFDGDRWQIVTGGIWVNVFLIWFFSCIIAFFHYKNEFNAFNKNVYVINDQSLNVYQDQQLIRTYPLHMYIRTKIDKGIYSIFGYRRLTIVLKPMRGQRVQIELLLIKSTRSQDIFNQIEQNFKNT